MGSLHFNPKDRTHSEEKLDNNLELYAGVINTYALQITSWDRLREKHLCGLKRSGEESGSTVLLLGNSFRNGR